MGLMMERSPERDLDARPVIHARPQMSMAANYNDVVYRVFGNFVSKEFAICPNCQHDLTDEEVRKGFSTNPLDFNTTCPECQFRFFANLIICINGKEMERVIYLCPDQTLNQMNAIKNERGQIGIVYLSKHNRQLYYNIVRHFGTYHKGIKRLKLVTELTR